MKFEVKQDIFSLSPKNFREAIAKCIPVGEKNAIASRDINARYVASSTDKTDRNTKTKRIKAALNWWSGNNSKVKVLPPAKCKQRLDGNYYWQNSNDLNIALNQELAGNMTLSKALAYSLVKEHFSNLMPPSELLMLAPYFEVAEKKLNQLKLVKGDRINASKYLPFCNQWKKEPINPTSYTRIFDAIEHKKVISAKYTSMHTGLVPDTVIISPQQILLQYEHTQVVAYLHNPIDGKNIYRHFDINRLSEITETEHLSYKIQHQPRKTFKLIALVHPWVRDKLTYVKLSDDQKITPWEQLNLDELALYEKITHFKDQKWAKVEATIELTSKFLDHHDEWDAWFFVNTIAIYGPDFIPLAPIQVVNEVNSRLRKATDIYTHLSPHLNFKLESD
ncbi:WYL domain-containing protein [Shewanella sp. 10N.286.51.B2]|uniref:WYL domain-containing protein n=1 Tax=Shewanella sp. 10N.286.51.B2 TaxID=3229707 RepID=UPI003551DC04